jgi:hypothetical protein
MAWKEKRGRVNGRAFKKFRRTFLRASSNGAQTDSPVLEEATKRENKNVGESGDTSVTASFSIGNLKILPQRSWNLICD